MLVFLGLVVFLVNMGAAWYLALGTYDRITRPLLSEGVQPSVAEKALKVSPEAKANTHILMHRLIEAEVHYNMIMHKHGLLLVCMALAFGLVAVGFALFVMGMEGAFELSVKTPDRAGGLALRSGAPGLLCFLLAAGIIVSCVLTKQTINLGPVTVYPDSNLPVSLNVSKADVDVDTLYKNKATESMKDEDTLMNNLLGGAR